MLHGQKALIGAVVSDQSSEMSGSLDTSNSLTYGRVKWAEGILSFFLSCSHPHFLCDLTQGLQCHAVPFKFKLAMGISKACED